ncbi:MAG: SDR family oxidoreductase [Blastomonas sp.]
MAEDFAGRIAVITGGARGMGRAYGEALAARGAKVVLIDLDGGEAEAAAAGIGGKAEAIVLDVTDDSTVGTCMAGIAERHGGIDILVNNAAIHSAEADQYFGQLGPARSRQMFDVNVWGVINCCLAAQPFMAGRPGASIINISSMASYGAQKAYGVTKLAVRGLTASFAHEFAPDGIRVNGIAPGLIMTETIRKELPESVIERVLPYQIIQRAATEDDVTGTLMWLISDAAAFVTGETIRVSGGAALTV